MDSGLRRNDPVGLSHPARKRIKDWLRPWKDRLIEEKTSAWRDLSHELGP
jgi:predicted GIY-YIG superfamily endonuclease